LFAAGDENDTPMGPGRPPAASESLQKDVDVDPVAGGSKIFVNFGQKMRRWRHFPSSIACPRSNQVPAVIQKRLYFENKAVTQIHAALLRGEF
jgi:hypothetical protein